MIDYLRLLDADAADHKAVTGVLRRFPLPPEWGVDLYLLDESTHPTGSLKHRLARALFRDALRRGALAPGATVVEATGGNAAVAQAYVARLLGHPFAAVMPRRSAPEKIARIEDLGGTVHLVHPPLAIYDEAERLAEQRGGHYMNYLAASADAIAASAGGEDDIGHVLFERLPVVPDWIVVGAGSGGTATAIGRRIADISGETRPRLAVVDPENSAYFPGWAYGADDYTTGMPSRIEGIGRPRVEPGFDASVVDVVMPVPDAASLAAMRFLCGTTGLRAGASTGTNLWGALQLVAQFVRDGRRGAIATLICDDGDLYPTTYWSDAWLDEKGIAIEPWTKALEGFQRTGVLEPPSP
ncbi:PLP-dependent cysteine synthase family protein [Actinomadura harenae]|uniref:Pyridoxal-phosphate dependent enzyme n=1 Tax=Actinomadura harenae TaxID=2483351 RepID=A0A3M2M7L3_9ACTN|nr:pyridoxal-phosphate dependent enzyme [Actinomadura harenae]RMI43088.1 pyridoxal-phosphate dependent enzyme [Actinomadura harenae]